MTLTFHDVKENNSPFASTVSSLSCNLLGTYVRLSAFCLTLANKLFLLLPRIGYPIPSSLHPSISVTSRINLPCCHIYISQYRQIGNSLSTYCFKFVVRLVSSAPYFTLTHDAPLFCCWFCSTPSFQNSSNSHFLFERLSSRTADLILVSLQFNILQNK